jgi:predicted house-cleaning noncanonical NTP pyrophosphatase (MazG superfamily)
MLIRDKVGQKMLEAIKEVKDKQVEIVKLTDNEEFLQAILAKIKSEIGNLEITRSVDSLAEIVELVDWIQVCFGSTRLDEVIEHRKDRLGLYWERFYIKDGNSE